MTSCPRCGRGAGLNAYACQTCAREAEADTAEIADFLRECDDKRARVGSRSLVGRSSPLAETPLPYDPRVSRVLAPVRNALTTWARLTHDEHPEHDKPPTDLADLATWLGDHAEWQATQPWGPDAFNDYTSCRESLRWLFDNPPETIALGACGGDLEDDTRCGVILSAPLDAAQHTCPRCGTTHDVAKRRTNLVNAAGDLLVTVKEASRLLRMSGRDIDSRTLHGLIRTIGIDVRGESKPPGGTRPSATYRLGSLADAVDLMVSNDTVRNAVRRAVRGA